MKLLATTIAFLVGSVGLFTVLIQFPITMVLAFPLVGVGLSVWHERQWRRRRHWIEVRGTVIGHHWDSDDTPFPEIEFDGAHHRRVFRSHYGGSTR